MKTNELTINEKQVGYAKLAHNRGLIDRFLADKVASSKPSYDVIETLVTLIETNKPDETINTFLSRMVR